MVSFSHGDISVGQNQGGEQQEIADDLPHPESWDFRCFKDLSPEKIFCYPNTLQEIPFSVAESLSNLVYDVCKSVKYKKPGAFQVLLLLPQLITPHSAKKKKKWAARCIMTNIHLFRKGRWETLLEKPPGLKPLMSFDKHKRALSQVKAGDFSAAARRTLTSLGTVWPQRPALRS